MANEIIKPAAAYIRVSTADQSPQMQLDVLRDYAARRGLKDVREFVDHGVSGTKVKRPALDALMVAARRREIGLVIVYRFDRFARSLKHLLMALEEFQALGVDFVSYSENLDSSTSMGKAMFSIIGALGELERNLIVERSVEGQRRARARGKHVGRPRTQVDEDYVAHLRASGSSLREIARKTGHSLSVVRRVLRETGVRKAQSADSPNRPYVASLTSA